MTDEFVDIEEAHDELLGAMREFSQENWSASVHPPYTEPNVK